MAKDRRKAGRKKKEPGTKLEADVRIKMTEAVKAAYWEAARANGYEFLSAWFRDCANERVARLKREGRLPQEFVIPADESDQPTR